MIHIYDNFLSQENQLNVNNSIKKLPYHYGEIDDDGTIPSGVVADFDLNCGIVQLFDSTLREKSNLLLDNLRIYRAYVNLFSPDEKSYFHIDYANPNAYTALYYANVEEWDKNEGGETQFLINNEIYGILPIPNRMVVFKANLLHKATSFHSRHRWSIAIKYTD